MKRDGISGYLRDAEFMAALRRFYGLTPEQIRAMTMRELLALDKRRRR